MTDNNKKKITKETPKGNVKETPKETSKEKSEINGDPAKTEEQKEVGATARPEEEKESSEAAEPGEQKESSEAAEPAKEKESSEAVKPEEEKESSEAVKPEEEKESREAVKQEEEKDQPEKAEKEIPGLASMGLDSLVMESSTAVVNPVTGNEEEPIPVNAVPDVQTEPQIQKEKIHVGTVIGRIFLGLVTAAAAAAGGYYGYGAYYYSSHYYDGTTAVIKSADNTKECKTEDLSGMTAQEAINLISAYTDDYVLTISSTKGTTDQITASDIDYKVTEDSLNELQAVMDQQDYMKWILHMTDPAKAAVSETMDMQTAYDETKLEDAIETLECISPSSPDEGADAYLAYNESEYRYEIIDPVVGNIGDREDISDKIVQCLDTDTTELDLTDEDYVQPEIKADDPELIARRDNIDKYLDAEITVSDHGKTIVVDGSVIIDFLDIDDDWNVTLNESKITDYVNSNFDAAFDTKGKERTVELKDSGTVTMSVGTFGDMVRTADEVPKLIEEISAGEIVEREPCYYNNYEVDGNGGIGDTYIDVNITQQKVYVVMNGEDVITTDCVTGLTNGTRDTPIGFYYIWGMTTNFTMTTYNSFVYYWMPIDETGVGLHDATWRSSFGGEIYKSNGSHGCINLPLDAAAEIYNTVYIGIPVIVHN